MWLTNYQPSKSVPLPLSAGLLFTVLLSFSIDIPFMLVRFFTSTEDWWPLFAGKGTELSTAQVQAPQHKPVTQF